MGETDFHASIILTIHREAIYLRRTLLSLDEAARFAQDRGLRLELVAVLDRTDEATRSVLTSFDLGTYHGHQILEVDHGSVGLARNDGIARARGTYIFTADADDLVSYNYFHDIYQAAERQGPGALHFPEYLLGFGDDSFICRYEDLQAVGPMTFMDKQPYISRLCAYRGLFADVSYRDVRLSPGYAYEDWHFNAEAVAAGYDIHTVADTILFYRQRPGSLLKSADAVSVRQIPPTNLFVPSIYLKVSKRSHEQFSSGLNLSKIVEMRTEEFLSGEREAMILAANAIDPSISIGRYRTKSIIPNYMGAPPLGTAYYALCDIVGDKEFSDIFLLPFLSRGGGEKYISSLIERMYRLDPSRNFLVFLGEDFQGVQWIDQLPPNAVVLDMALHCRSLSKQQRCMLALKMIEACSPTARLHLRQSAFADTFLNLYGAVLKDRETIYYRFNDTVRIENGHFCVIHAATGLIAEHLDCLSKIVCDNNAIIRSDCHRIGLQADKWHHIPSPVEAPAVLQPRTAEAQNRILWASRLDVEKRPSLLPHIAAELSRDAPYMTIEAFGGSVLEAFDPKQLEGWRNLRYRGPYAGFDTLPFSEFAIFLYTSLQDGIPNVLLEAMSRGMAVVAPDLGGIPEIVYDGETGILLPSLPDNEAMAASYAKALLTLSNDPDRIARLGSQARAFVLKHHSPEVHAQRVAAVFGLQPRLFQHAAEV